MSLFDSENIPEATVAAPLFLYPVGGKWLESAPEGHSVGAIRLRGWDLRAVKPLPSDYDGQDVYLAKLVYELDVDHGVPRPSWLEIGFSFSAEAETDAGADTASGPRATVLDALPRTVLDPQGGQAFQLNRSLMFVPHPDATDSAVFLNGQEPTIDVFGIGGPEIRWRHSETGKAPMRLGTRATWIVLAVPAGTDVLAVRVRARFGLRGGSDRPWTGSEPARFRLPLQPSGVAEPSTTGPHTRPGPGNPTIFICYAHEDASHRGHVREFGDFLVAQGCDVRLDAYVASVRDNWDMWGTRAILGNRFSAVIASPRLRAVGDGEVGANENRGLQSELGKLGELLQRDRTEWTKRILPVVLPGCRVEDIPLNLYGFTANHYKITSLTPHGAKTFLDTVFHEFGGRRPFVEPTAV